MMASQERRRSTFDWFVAHPTVEVRTWAYPECDPPIEQLGYDARHLYVETYWLPVLGPSAILASRRFADWLFANPAGVKIELVEFGASLGIGAGTGRNTQINRTISRLIDFRMARIVEDHLEVRTVFPPVPLKLRRRLPLSLLDALADHEQAWSTT